MKKVAKINILLALAIMAAGMVVAGCKSAPDLTQAQALTMIQAKYDATAPTGAGVTVNNDGMVAGVTAKYWTRTTIYPNKYWADFTLTADGKKVLKLESGGDVIKWRPQSPTDKDFSIAVETVQANHLKARDIKDVQDGVGGMNQDACEMMAARVQAEQPAVGHVRQPGERMPVADIDFRERPFDTVPGQPLLHHRILRDV